MSAFLSPDFLKEYKSIAIGLSGGPDSLALTHMLSQLCSQHNLTTNIHALIINHNLRAEAADEAEKVAEIAKTFPCVTPVILKWDTPETDSRIMEAARNARYDLMAHYCAEQDIKYLYIAHHLDDQAETFLFRLAKGSGLDGLCGMREIHDYSDDLTILRPLLGTTKEELLSYCEQHNLPFVQDPSNQKQKYARPRLRKSKEVLEAEGLTSKRLAITAHRMNRAKDALTWLAKQASEKCLEAEKAATIINLEILKSYPDEIRFRVIRQAVTDLTVEKDYAPRMEKLENLVEEIFQDSNFRKQTFAHLIFEKAEKDHQTYLHLKKEEHQ